MTEVVTPLTADMRALHALALYDAYLSIPQDRGGPNGQKGRAHQAWLDAKDAALSTPAVTAPPKGEGEPVAWRNVRIVADAANPRNRRITSDTDHHICKVYGYDPEQAQAKAEIIVAALSRPNPVSAELVERLRGWAYMDDGQLGEDLREVIAVLAPSKTGDRT